MWEGGESGSCRTELVLVNDLVPVLDVVVVHNSLDLPLHLHRNLDLHNLVRPHNFFDNLLDLQRDLHEHVLRNEGQFPFFG
jgi:hypothetical protein